MFTCRLAWCSSSPLSSSLHCNGPLHKQNVSVIKQETTCLGQNRREWDKLTHADVIFAAITPDVIGHLKP